MMQLCEKKELLNWLCCPRCGGKTRTQIRPNTVLEDFPLFCPKCKYTGVTRFRNGSLKVLLMQVFQTAASVLMHRLPPSAKPHSRILPQRGIKMEEIKMPDA